MATFGVLLTLPLLLALAAPLPFVAVLGFAFLAGIGVETFAILWDTAMQQEIPADRLSRVYSYDALGSWALVPLGYAIAGPVSEAIGTRPTLMGAAAFEPAGDRLRAVRAGGAAPAPAGPGAVDRAVARHVNAAELGELEAFRDLYAAAPPGLGARSKELGDGVFACGSSRSRR